MTSRRGPLQDPRQLRGLLDIEFSAAQLAAATAPLHPAVIVAGAGSGKTTVMAARVVWLVGTGAVRADQVLGLTFTTKAAGELAQRIRAALGRAHLLGDEVDGLPTVSTYHSYAASLVREHGLRLGAEPRAALLADATRFQLAERVVRAAPGPFTGITKQVNSLVADLLRLDAELSEHLVPLAELREHDRDLCAALDALPRAGKRIRELHTAAVARTELGGLVEDYRAEKARRSLLDFGDQIALAARLAEEHTEVGAGERERFRIVLLDEYQDTSVAQRRMLHGLYPGGHPVIAVGDPCQAIYGWRGASVANLDDFPVHFARADGSPADRYGLVENRRSGSRLLVLANALARELHLLHEVAGLEPCAARMHTGETVCALLPTYAEEVAWSADQVVAALREGVPAREVAVLVRARSDFAALHAALVERDVPVEVVGLGGLLALPEVADVVATLQVVTDATANAALVRLLSGPRWRIGPRDLALLGRRARDLAGAAALPGGDALAAAVAGVDPVEVVALLDAVERPGPELSVAARERLRSFAAEIAGLRRVVGDPLLDVVSRVVEVLGLEVELAAGSGRQDRQEALAAFLDVAARFGDLDGTASVPAFLGFLRAAEDYDRGLDSTVPSTADSVKLMTAHKAKGLEWEVVVLPDLTKDVFPSGRGRSRWPTTPGMLPGPLRGDAATLPSLDEFTPAALDTYIAREKEWALLEERRLAYVAVTRARSRLVASAHWWGPTQKRHRGPSPYLLTVRAHALAGNGRVEHWADRPADDEHNPLRERPPGQWEWPAPLEPVALRARRTAAEAVLAGLERPPPAVTATDPAQAAVIAGWRRDAGLLLAELRAVQDPVREVALPGALSTTQLVRVAADPEALARELARPMPRPPAEAARRGTAFHAWVESRFAQQPLLDPGQLPGAADADIEDDSTLAELQEAFLRTPYAERVPHAVEAPFEMLLAGRVVRGRIDAVYRDGEGFEVVDWKTGREAADPLQLAVYRLAWAELAGVPPAQVAACFLYVRSGRVERPSRLPDAAELAALLRSRTSAA